MMETKETPDSSKQKTKWTKIVLCAGAIAGIVAFLGDASGLWATTRDRVGQQCSNQQNWVREVVLRCKYATTQEAETVITSYYDISSGSSPLDGRRYLTRELQKEWTEDAFSHDWSHIGWSELVGVPLPVAGAEGNVFEVVKRSYGSPTDDSTDTTGFVAERREQIRLSRQGAHWKIATVDNLGRTEKPREYVRYGIAILKVDQPAYVLPTATSNPTKTWRAGGTLPIYCLLEDQGGGDWLRTSVGWIESELARGYDSSSLSACEPGHHKKVIESSAVSTDRQ